MNNIKDFLYESILDDVDSKIDNETELDDAVDNMLYNKVIDALGLSNSFKYDNTRCRWDRKTKTIRINSSDYNLHLFVRDGKILVRRNPPDYVELDELVNAGVKFDCNLKIHVDCIRQGLKLSSCNIVGKNHTLRICGKDETIDLSQFIDISPKPCFDSIMLPMDIGNIPQCCSKAISKFKNCIFNCGTCTQAVFEKCINEIKHIKCDVLYIRWMSATDAFNVKSSRYNAADVLGDEFFNIAHDVKYIKHDRPGQYMQKQKTTITEVCKKLIEQNPGTKILVGLYGEAVQVWEENDKIEYKIISKIASEPWRKV